MTRTETSITFLTETASEKRAIRVMAAEEGKLIGEWIRDILYEHTALKERAAELEARLHLDNRKLVR